MPPWLRIGSGHVALLPAAVIWGFGYLLIGIFSSLLGRSPLGLILPFSLPMFVLGVGQTLALDWLREEMHGVSRLLRWATLMAAAFAATAIQTLFDLCWLRWASIALVPEWQEWALQITPQRLYTTGITYLWAFGLAMTLLWAIRIRGAAEVNATRAARAEAAAIRAEAAALRLQLNPHFMFNALNSISSLILLDRKHEAEEMIDRLCEFLRGSLYSDPTADVPLAQEIDSVDAYLSIEAARFGEDLEIEIDVDPEIAEVQVPNFILQPLVENAIKHGVGAVGGPASVSVSAGRDGEAVVLSVTNTVSAARAAAAESTSLRPGIGLANIRQRLTNHYGKGARLETGPTPSGYRAVIRLPLQLGVRKDDGSAL